MADPSSAVGALSSLQGKVCLVTGASGAMGRVIATELARAGATVVVSCRTLARGDALRSDILSEIGGLAESRVEVLPGDLMRQDDVRAVARGFLARHDRLDVLVNNAGALYREVRHGTDGTERHLAVNHLAGFLLTTALLPALRAAGSARVINVVTDMINDTRAVKLSPRPRPASIDPLTLVPPSGCSPLEAYAAAKLAAVMCGYALAKELAGTGVTVNAVHPGVVASGIIDAAAPGPVVALYRQFLLTPERGAQPILRLATDPLLVDFTGRYYVRFVEARSPAISYDGIAQRLVLQASRRLVDAPR